MLPEKGSDISELRAAPSFRLLATMNPGGDFGKKELSPALRNRFTEVWVPTITARAELLELLGDKLPDAMKTLPGWDPAEAMLAFVEWLGQPRAGGGGGGGGGGGKGDGGAPSLRDLLAWTSFTAATVPTLGAPAAYVHGACLTFVDGIGLQAASSRAERTERRRACIERLRALLPSTAGSDPAALGVSDDTVPLLAAEAQPRVQNHPDPSRGGGRVFGLAPFFLPAGPDADDPARAPTPFSLRAPTSRANAFRALRAMQLRKPVLLEGSEP